MLEHVLGFATFLLWPNALTGSKAHKARTRQLGEPEATKLWLNTRTPRMEADKQDGRETTELSIRHLAVSPTSVCVVCCVLCVVCCVLCVVCCVLCVVCVWAPWFQGLNKDFKGRQPVPRLVRNYPPTLPSSSELVLVPQRQSVGI